MAVRIIALLPRTLVLVAMMLAAPILLAAEDVLLRVGGLVDRPLELTRSDLAGMRRDCVRIPSRDDPKKIETWEGCAPDRDPA